MENKDIITKLNNDKKSSSVKIEDKTKFTYEEIQKLFYNHHEGDKDDILDILKITKKELHFLINLSVLPAETKINDIKDLLGLDSNDNINSLVEKGWLIKKNNFNIFMHNIIQEVVRKNNEDKLSSDCSLLISNLINRLETDEGGNLLEKDYQKALNYVSYSESFIKHGSKFEDMKYDISFLLERLGTFYRFYGNFEKSLEYYKYETILFEELYNKNPTHIGFKNGLATSFQNLGNIYSDLGDFEKSLQYYKDYTRITEEVYKENPTSIGFKNNLAISFEKLGDIYSKIGDFNKVLKYYKEYNRLEEELHKEKPTRIGFKNNLAISFEKLGDIYSKIGDFNKVLKYYKEYNRLEEELYNENLTNLAFKNNLAISYIKLASLQKNEKEPCFYLNKAKELLGELIQDSPLSYEFKKNLEEVENDLKQLAC